MLIDLETASLGYAVHRHPPMVIDFAMIVKSISGTHNTQIETYEKRLKECERNIDGLQAELDEVVGQGVSKFLIRVLFWQLTLIDRLMKR